VSAHSDAKKIHSRILSLSDENPLVVFDLDSTLFNVSFRTQNILQDFANEGTFQKKYPEEVASLKTIQVLSKDWGIRESLARHAIRGTITFFEELRLYWRERFFASHYLKHDQPYPGAVTYVNSLFDADLRVIYLTGRDRPHMFEGTVASLKQHGFPLENEELQLFMKPAKGSTEDEDFKALIMHELRRDHRHVFLFDNEPVILNKVLKEHPDIHAIFMDTVHCGRETPPPGLPVIPGVFEH
jgi:hypothetical protein